MKKNSLIILFTFISASLTAQVGINTDTPNASLDIIALDSTNPKNNEGLLIPRINEFPATNPTIEQNGMLVFMTGSGTPEKGFYYWDQAENMWQLVSNSSSIVEKIDDLSDAKSDNDDSENGSSIFFGIGAGQEDNETDNKNIGIGFEALNSNKSGEDNTAIGYQALYTANGIEDDLYYLASANVAIGTRSLFNNVYGNANIGIGKETLYNNTFGSRNIALGDNALNKNIDGDNNIAIGSSTLRSNTEGVANIGHGVQALYNNTTGNFNIAIGSTALYTNKETSGHIAIGPASLHSMELGDSNIAIGLQSMADNRYGNYNVAIGRESFENNSGGNNNTALGFRALGNSKEGNNNIAIGPRSLFANEGNDNIANGLESLYSNVSGNGNIALGYLSLRESTGSDNIGIGSFAGNQITQGNNNINLGFAAQVPNSSGSNQVRIGNSSITYAGIQVPWTVTSDFRFKQDIHEIDSGLAIVNKLKPVNYVRKNDERQKKEFGFIAQDVEKVLNDLNMNNHGIYNQDDDGLLSLRYNDFIPLLTKAIQEQQSQIEELKKEINQLKSKS